MLWWIAQIPCLNLNTVVAMATVSSYYSIAKQAPPSPCFPSLCETLSWLGSVFSGDPPTHTHTYTRTIPPTLLPPIVSAGNIFLLQHWLCLTSPVMAYHKPIQWTVHLHADNTKKQQWCAFKIVPYYCLAGHIRCLFSMWNNALPEWCFIDKQLQILRNLFAHIFLPNMVKPHTIKMIVHKSTLSFLWHIQYFVIWKMMMNNTVRKTKEAENTLISIQEKHAKHVYTKGAIFNAPILLASRSPRVWLPRLMFISTKPEHTAAVITLTHVSFCHEANETILGKHWLPFHRYLTVNSFPAISFCFWKIKTYGKFSKVDQHWKLNRPELNWAKADHVVITNSTSTR